jgi:1,4-alpha-glucan branching enzyme
MIATPSQITGLLHQGKGTYKIILSTDDLDCGGFGRIDTSLKYHTLENNMLSIYLPSRTSVVMKKQS